MEVWDMLKRVGGAEVLGGFDEVDKRSSRM